MLRAEAVALEPTSKAAHIALESLWRGRSQLTAEADTRHRHRLRREVMLSERLYVPVLLTEILKLFAEGDGSRVPI
jgi:hypothetical protein